MSDGPRGGKRPLAPRPPEDQAPDSATNPHPPSLAPNDAPTRVAHQDAVSNDDAPTRVAAQGRRAESRLPSVRIDPGFRGADSPNETVMLPPTAVQPPSAPPAYAPVPPGWRQPPPTGEPMPTPHGFGPQTPYGGFPPAQTTGPQPLPAAQVTGPQRALRSYPPHPSAARPPEEDSGDRGPGSFSRIFLGSVEKYRGKSGHVGSASQEAAVMLAASAAPEDKRASGPTLRLRSPLALVETAVLTLLLPLIGFAAHRNDPFFLDQHFSWIIVAPLLLGLRHGFAPAIASALTLDGMIAIAWRTQIVPLEKLPGETMVGLAALAMVTGQFSDVWKRELVRLDSGFDVVRRQLGEVLRAHFLLELSHDRLEERMGKGTPNLRDALVAVQRAVALRPAAKLADLSTAIADIFATYTMVEVGAVYQVDNDRLATEPIAKIGRPQPLDINDEQLVEALRTKKLTFIRANAADGGAARTKLLAVVPFVDAKRRLRGLLTIESIPLLAFERRNLEALAILGGRFADAVSSRGRDTTLQRGQKKELEIRVRRAIADLIESDVTSTLFVLIVRKGGAASDSIETVLGGTLRALDFPYIERDALGNYVVYILLPLTDEAGARAFAGRIERIVRREGNMPLARAGGFHFHHVLRPEDTVEGVMTTLEAKAKLDESAVEHTIVV